MYYSFCLIQRYEVCATAVLRSITEFMCNTLLQKHFSAIICKKYASCNVMFKYNYSYCVETWSESSQLKYSKHVLIISTFPTSEPTAIAHFACLNFACVPKMC